MNRGVDGHTPMYYDAHINTHAKKTHTHLAPSCFLYSAFLLAGVYPGLQFPFDQRSMDTPDHVGHPITSARCFVMSVDPCF